MSTRILPDGRPSTPSPVAQARPRSGSAGSGAAVIEALADSALPRLRLLTLVAGCGFAAAALLAAALVPVLGADRDTLLLAALAAVLAVGAWTVRGAAGRLADEPARLLRLGVVFTIGVSAALAVAEVAVGPIGDQRYQGIPGLCLWLVIGPLLIPSTPRQAVWAAVAGALALPAAYGLALAIGRTPTDPGVLVRWWAPVAFAAGLAALAAAATGRLAADLARARRTIRELGTYRLIDRLGSGGMGEVWRGRHRLLPREAAVKIIRGDSADAAVAADRLRRLRAEAQAIAALRSPHTVQLNDVGTTEDGSLFYAMELLDGLDLRTLVQRHGPQPAERIAGILAQACLSLAEAHGRGLVHRDVTPGNMMLCRLGVEVEVVKVLDFGLVSGGGPEGAAGTTGAAGTPGYIAPEVLRGLPAEPRSDLFALAATGVWLRTGREVGGSGSITDLCRAAEGTAALLDGDGSPLADLLRRCLDPDPGRRPADARAVRDALLRLAAWDEATARDWWDRHRPPA